MSGLVTSLVLPCAGGSRVGNCPVASARRTSRRSSRVSSFANTHAYLRPGQQRHVNPKASARGTTVVVAAEGPNGFFHRLFTGELGVPPTGGGSSSASVKWQGDESVESAMLREVVLQDTVLFSRKLRLAYDAKQHGWTANSFHSKCDNQGPSILIAKTKGGGYFGAYNPIGVASREDYRECFGAFLVKWPKVNSTKEAPIFLPQTGGGPSIFDFGAEGPIFGTSALKIPLGQAPSMGSSYAQFSGNSLGGGGKEIKEVKSRLGEYQNDENPQRSLFGAKDGKHETALVELRAYVGEGLDGFYG